MDCNLSWNTSFRHLIRVLLDFEFLEFRKFGSSVLEVQPPARFIFSAFFRQTICQRFEAWSSDRLKNFWAASIACISRNFQLRFYFCRSKVCKLDEKKQEQLHLVTIPLTDTSFPIWFALTSRTAAAVNLAFGSTNPTSNRRMSWGGKRWFAGRESRVASSGCCLASRSKRCSM